MGLKQKIFKAVAPSVVQKVTENLDEIIDICISCKGENEAAIKECPFWVKKKIYRCEKVADKLDEIKSGIQTDKILAVSDKIGKATDKVKGIFKKKEG